MEMSLKDHFLMQFLGKRFQPNEILNYVIILKGSDQFVLRRKQSIESKDMISLVFVMGQNSKEQEVVGINSI